MGEFLLVLPCLGFHFSSFLTPQLQGQEGPNIAKCFKSKDFTAFMAGGVYAERVSYLFLREEYGKIVFAKKKES